MSYNPTNWQNLPNTTSPVIAPSLNNMETGISENDVAIGKEVYDNTQTYDVGDYCIYNNVLYRCKTAVTTAESFDSSKWEATNITSRLKLMDRNIVTAKVNSTTTMAQQYTNYTITGYTVADRVGTLLSVDNNGVIIPAGVNKVLLFAQARFDDLVNGDRVFLYINRNRNGTWFSPSANTSGSSGTTTTLTVLPFICSCQEGDYFQLNIQNNGGARGKVDGTIAGSNYSFLTVEVIE